MHLILSGLGTVVLVSVSAFFNRDFRSLEPHELSALRGGMIDFLNCAGSTTCTAVNNDGPCGIDVQGVCVPVVSLCYLGTNCTGSLANRCVTSLFGDCKDGGIPVVCLGVKNIGDCVNPLGGSQCRCIDTGVEDTSQKCNDTTHECS
jgi:hypothetical protein